MILENYTNEKTTTMLNNSLVFPSHNTSYMGINHDMKTLTNGVLCMTKILEQTALNIEQTEVLHLLKNSAEQLSSMMAQMLDMRQQDAAAIAAPIKSFKTQNVIENVFKTFSLTIKHKPIALKLHLDKTIPAILKGDKLALVRVLNNLLSNAANFTEQGEIALCVQVTKIDNHQVTLNFSIKDSGAGISKQNLTHIFKEYTKFNSKGHGLGLAVVKQLVEKAKGTVTVESKEKQGSTFSFTMPFEIARFNAIPVLKQGALYPASAFAGKSVLIIDDDKVYTKYLTTLLSANSAHIHSATNGEAGIEKGFKYKYDLILIDVNLPDADGHHIAQQIRQKEHINAQTPIVNMSATIGDRSAMGMIPILTKPFKVETLTQYLDKKDSTKSSQKISIKTKHLNSFHFDEHLDAFHLKKLYGNDIEHASLMFTTFCEETLLTWNELFALRFAHNATKIKENIHRLIPAFSMVGLTGIEQHMRHIEQHLTHYSASEIAHELNEIQQEIDTHLPFIKEELALLKAKLRA